MRSHFEKGRTRICSGWKNELNEPNGVDLVVFDVKFASRWLIVVRHHSWSMGDKFYGEIRKKISTFNQ